MLMKSFIYFAEKGLNFNKFLILCIVGLFLLPYNQVMADKYEVTNNGTDGAGSLYQAILDANAHQGLDTVLFDTAVRDTIKTSGCLPDIIESLVIIGPGADLLVLDSEYYCRVLKTDEFYNDSLFIYGLTLTHGDASGAGAGVYLDGGKTFFYNCRIVNNENSYQNIAGGGVYVFGGSAWFFGCEISSNSSYIGGSGITVAANAKVYIYNSVISHNTTIASSGQKGGGGIYNVGELFIENSTISGNSHPAAGGGIYNLLYNRKIHINHSTITNNSADMGGGIYNRDEDEDGTDTIWLKNTLIANNTASTEGNDLWGNYISEGNNLIEDATGANITGETGSDLYSEDPLLGDLGYFNYETRHHPLQENSPAIDNASETDFLPDDQLGNPRPLDGDMNGTSIADIGAVEYFLDSDGDGVRDTEEQGANGETTSYDGNNDDTPDKNQKNVTSLKTYDGEYYITIAAPENTVLSRVKALDYPGEEMKKEVSGFDLGFFSFKMDSLQNADSPDVQLFIPSGMNMNEYYNLGPTPETCYPHMYSFLFDDETGAEMSGGQIILHLSDGALGDHDLTENNAILTMGGPSIGEVSNIQKLSGEALSPFPNPFGSVVYFPVPEGSAGQVSVSIYDISGRKMLRKIMPSNENPLIAIDGEDWDAGVYLYYVRSGASVFKGKLMKLHRAQ